MKIKKLLVKSFLLLLFATINHHLSVAYAQHTAFNYSGFISSNGVPITATGDMIFTLFTDETGGSMVSGPIIVADVPVTKGVFKVELDFGNVYDGSPRWIEIQLRVTWQDWVTFSPRQKINSVPYASKAASAYTATHLDGVVTAESFIGTYDKPLTFSDPSNTYYGSFIGNG